MGVITYHVYWRVIGNAIGLLLHGGNSIVLYFAMQGEILKDPDIATLKATQFKFITIWNVAFQLLLVSMNLVCDISIILKYKQDHKYLEYLRSYKKVLYASIVFPITVMIFFIFWPVFIYNRELIFPAFIDKAISLTSNHIMHTAIMPIALCEFFFQPRTEPSSHKWHFAHIAAIYISYSIVVLTNYADRGTWPYPFMGMIYGTIYFPILFAFILTLYLTCYFVQWPLNTLIFKTCIKSDKIR